MAEVRPLPIYPWPLTPERAAVLRAAKASMDVPWLIQPEPAAPGGPGRVLAYGAVPPFACEAVLVAAENAESPERIAAALSFLMSAPADARGLITHEMWLSAVMGMDVKFLYEMAHDEFTPPTALDPSHDEILRAKREGREVTFS